MKVPQSISELFLATVTTATSSEPSAQPAGVRAAVIKSHNLCIYLAGRRAGTSSVTEQTGSTTCQSVAPINRSSYSKRPFISSSREELQPGPLSHSLVAFWDSWQALGALWWTVVGCLGRGPILRMSDGGLFYSHGKRRPADREIWEASLAFFPYFFVSTCLPSFHLLYPLHSTSFSLCFQSLFLTFYFWLLPLVLLVLI